ncbi:hypothetical protein MMC28_002146 [Mycoblastus sanguinarius]|nr:hypothetical protein [Mycoblastus sanguinarius]
MAENIPPASSSADASRGVPYYEKLKRDLRETLQKKRLLDKNMATLEDQIYRYEASYLEETGAGNIIKGFDNYIKGSTTGGTASGNAGGGGGGGGGGGTSTRRKGQVMEGDRVFSRSSASFMRGCALLIAVMYRAGAFSNFVGADDALACSDAYVWKRESAVIGEGEQSSYAHEWEWY